MGIFSGSSDSSGGIFGGGGGSDAPTYVPHKRKKPKRSVRGFLGNAADELSSSVHGFFPGVKFMATHPVDAAKGVYHGYTDEGTFWHELIADRDLKSAGRVFYENPLGPTLDAAGLVTLGAGSAGAAAARGAAVASKAGRAGAAGRLARFSALDPVTMKPLTYEVSVPGVGSMTRTVKRNQLLRPRQRVFEAASARYPNAPGLGTRARVTRDVKRRDRTMDAREEMKALRPVRSMVSGLSKPERAALWIAVGGHEAGKLKRYYESTLDRVISEKLQRKHAGSKSVDREAPIALPDAGDVKQLELPDQSSVDAPQVEPRIIGDGAGGPPARTGTAKPDGDTPSLDVAVRGPDDRGGSLLLDENGSVRRADTNEDIRYEEGSLDAVIGAVSKMSDRELSRVMGRLQKRITEVEKVQRSGVLDKPSNAFQKATRALRDLSADTSQRMIQLGKQAEEGAVQRSMLESELMRRVGVVDEAYAGGIRSHVNMRPDKFDTGHGRGMKYSKPGELDLFRRNTGYSFHYALDNTSPQMYLHSARQVFQYQQRIRRFNTMLSNAVWMRPDDAAFAEKSGWKAIEAGSKLRRDIDMMYATLVDAENIFDGLPGYDDLVRSMEQSLIHPDGSVDTVPMIPSWVHKELTGEFERANQFIEKWVDKPTRIWRSLTLNFRPAWITNNYVGQMLLLATAYGVPGLKEYVMSFSLPGRAKRLRVDADGNPILDANGREQYGKFDAFSELAPELSDFGWAHESNLGDADLRGNKATRGIRRMSDFMGALNQKLTDDHTRRAAFMAEIRPRVRKYQKAHPGTSFEDAARELWKDEQFADEVTRRVLDNMIDFTDLSNVERKYIKRVIPFYSWMRGITKRTGQIALDEPWKLAAGAAVGSLGLQRNEELYGPLPERLLGMVGVGGKNVVLTQGMNPFMTPADIVGMVTGLVREGGLKGTQNPLVSLNPIFKAPLEAVTNYDLFYGRPIVDERYSDEKPVPVKLLGRQVVGSFPQTRIWKQYQDEQKAQRGELGYAPLYEPSLANALWSYLGYSKRTLDLEAVRRSGLKEQQSGYREG